MLRILVGIFLGVSLVAWPAGASTIDVFPGPGTPLQDAIDAASDGARLRIHAGTYPEAVVVSKPLKLVAALDGDAVIDAGCAAAYAVDVAADRVLLQGERHTRHRAQLLVQGGTLAQIRVGPRDRVQIKLVIATGPCAGGTGIEVSGATRARLVYNRTEGAFDAGLALRTIALGANVRVVQSGLQDGVIGLLLEDIAPGAPLGRGGVLVKNVGAVGGQTSRSILLRNADGVNLVDSTAIPGADSGIDIELDTFSDNNVIRNGVFGGGGIDDGTGNCWRGNAFGGTPVPPPCP